MHPTFTYTLDAVYKPGVDYRVCNRMRERGEDVSDYYYPHKTSIYLSWSFAGRYYKENVKYKILPSMWNFSEKLPSKKYKYYQELSVMLKDILARVEKQFLHVRIGEEEMAPDSIRELVRRVINGPSDVTGEKKGLLWRVFDEFIEEKKHLSAPSTIAKYETLQKHLQTFEKLKYPMTFEVVTMRWYNEFLVYCIGKAFLTNTTGKLVAMMKAFMNYAYDRKFTRNLEFKKFKVKSETTEPISLIMEELQAIEKYNPGTNTSLAISRDVFIVGCFAGQRISDLLAMKRKDLKESKEGEVWWEVHQVKTRKVVRVFIINKARRILEKYLNSNSPDGYVFPRISPVVINRSLKIIGKAAGLTEEVSKLNYCANKKREVTGPKYMFLTTHVARKTFVSMLCSSNMPDHEIQSLSGHASAREMKVYKRIDKSSIRNQMIALFDPI